MRQHFNSLAFHFDFNSVLILFGFFRYFFVFISIGPKIYNDNRCDEEELFFSCKPLFSHHFFSWLFFFCDKLPIFQCEKNSNWISCWHSIIIAPKMWLAGVIPFHEDMKSSWKQKLAGWWHNWWSNGQALYANVLINVINSVPVCAWTWNQNGSSRQNSTKHISYGPLLIIPIISIISCVHFKQFLIW